ncbi:MULTISPECIES: hypothetical protein [Streptomonospora]|uniref:Uncharacterized protein n=2 Tax=Streptomonospora TaxID=104204 RepID=A0ABV9SKN3_9ACTN
MATMISDLRDWIRDHDPHVRAAVELLIAHNDAVWLRREDFVDRFVDDDGHNTVIDFATLAAALEAGTAPGACETEAGVLRLAADLGTDRWGIRQMSDAAVHRVRVAIAVATE